MKNISNDLATALESAKKAGEIIKNAFGNIQEILEKEGKGVVTEVDKESEKAIIEILQRNSSYPILAEETKNQMPDNKIFWAVDPLDGTTSYSRGIPLIGVSIALINNNKPILGVLNNPLTDQLFFGEMGAGAFLNNSPILASKKRLSNESVMFVNHGYGPEDRELSNKITQTFVKTCALRKFGSTALELCYVAKGSAEAFIASGDELWDHAAGIAILEAAGGKITDWRGKDFDNSNSFILASNGEVHEEILKKIKHLQF